MSIEKFQESIANISAKGYGEMVELTDALNGLSPTFNFNCCDINVKNPTREDPRTITTITLTIEI